MATNRDVTLGVGVETTGEESLRGLADEVRKLAKTGGEAGPQFEQFADELSRLSEQAAQLDAFKRAAAGVEAFTSELKKAETASEAVAASLGEQRERTDALTNSENAAKAAQIDATAAVKVAQIELDRFVGAQTKLTKAEADYSTTLASKKDALADLKLAREAATNALREASDAAKLAAADEKKLADSSKFLATQTSNAAAALAAEEARMRAANVAANALGLSLDDVSQAQAGIAAESQKISSAAGLAKLASDAAQLAAQTGKAEAEATRLADAWRKFQGEVKAKENASEMAAFAAKVAEAKAETAQLAAQTKQAGEAVKGAFGAAGVRSLQAIDADTKQLTAHMDLLEAEFRQGSISAQDFSRALAGASVKMAQFQAEARTIPALPGVFERLNTSITGVINKFGALSAAVATVGFAVAPILDANIKLESLRRTLTAVTGSASAANEQIRFLEDTAARTGLAVGGLTDSFSLFTSSMLKSGQSVATTKALFSGVADASNTLGLSTEKTGLILNALGQIANKGKVSLEELQGQIGESLPGALKIAADSLGLTVSQMQKLIASGQLLSSELLPAMGPALQAAFGGGVAPVQGLQQAFNNLRSAATKTAQQLVDTSAYKGLTEAVQIVARNLDGMVSVVGAAGRAFLAFKAINIAREFLGVKAAAEAAAVGVAKQTVATTQAAVAEGKAAIAVAHTAVELGKETVALSANTAATATNAAARSGLTLAASKEALAVGAGKIASSAGVAATAMKGLSGAMGGPIGLAVTLAATLKGPLEDGLSKLYNSLTGVTAKQKEAEAQLRRLNFQHEMAERGAAQLAASYVRLKVDQLAVVESTEKAAATARKRVEAAKEEAETSAKLTALMGDEVAARAAAAKLAGSGAQAALEAADADRRELAAKIDLRETLIAQAGGYAQLEAAHNKQIQEQVRDIDALIAKKAEDAKGSLARAEAAKIEAAEAKVLAESTKDNSGRLTELKAARDAAAEGLAKYMALEREGRPQGAAMLDMKVKLAEAELKYSDALGDTTRNLVLQQKQMEATNVMARAGLSVRQAEAQANEKVAASLGDERQVTEAKIQSKRVEIDVIRQATAEKRAEAEANIKTLESTKAGIKGHGDAADAARAEIDVRIKLEQAKIRETAAGEANVRGINAEIDALQRHATASNSAAASLDGLSARAKAMDEDTAKRKAERDAANNISIDTSVLTTLQGKLKSGTLSPDDLRLAEAAAAAEQANLGVGGGARGAISFNTRLEQGGASARAIVDAIRDLVNARNAEQPLQASAQSFGSGPESKPDAPPQSVGASRTVNINIGGVSSSISTSSSSDASKLEAVLRQLASASGRAA